MKEPISRRTNTLKWSLAVRGARLQFSIAVALISIVPSLSLLHLAGGAGWVGSGNAQAWLVAIFGVAASMFLGYALLAKYPATVIRLRAYVQNMVKGEMPDRISLMGNEDDITAIESSMNLILSRLKGRLETVEAQKSEVEEQLFQARKMEALGTLASGVAHEINTPLQFISNNVQFLKTACDGLVRALDAGPSAASSNADGGPGPDLAFLRKETMTAIEQSREGVARIAEIVRAIRDFADAGARNEKMPIDINEAVEATIALTKNKWKHAATIETNLDPDLPRVPCVAAEIKRVLMNLLLNASEALATKAKSEGVNAGRILITTSREGQSAVVTIKDNGPGIPEGIRNRIFDPFFTTKEVGQGIGEGLSFVYSSVVNRHAGRLTFDSVEGEGTTFKVSLPLGKPE
jgi:signal transduction histidine kinase